MENITLLQYSCSPKNERPILVNSLLPIALSPGREFQATGATALHTTPSANIYVRKTSLEFLHIALTHLRSLLY